MNSPEAILAEIPLFKSLPLEELNRVAGRLRHIELPAGTLLFFEGEIGDHMYIILDGQIEIVKALATPDERVLALRGAGEFVGEMSLLEVDQLRTASVRAYDAVHLAELGRSDFNELLDRNPRMAFDMVRVLSQRLNASHNGALRVLQEKNRQLEQAYEELKAAQQQIIEKEKLERELQVAHNIQMSILPRRMPALSGFDFGVRFEPMTAVGGDFYDFIPLGENKLGIALGDVSGHGVPAALFMALTVTMIRAEACHDCSPSEVMRKVNQQLINLNDEGMFVTILYGILDCSSGEFIYVRAGHEPPVLCSPAGDLIELGKGGGPFLGFFEDPIFVEQTLSLAPGSTMLLYTDGITEAMNTRKEMFETGRIYASVKANRTHAAQDVCEQMLAQVLIHTGPTPQNDDITLVCVQAK